MQQSENTSEQPQLLKIPQVAQTLGVSRAMVYTLISQGLPVIRLNRSVRVSVASLRQWIEEQERKQSKE